MQIALAATRWESYAGASSELALFSAEPLSYNSRQARLHRLKAGDQLWLVSRNPEDRQYYAVAILHVAALRVNRLGSSLAEKFGEFSVLADPHRSLNLGTRFAVEDTLRALNFDPSKPIKYGATIGQSLQTIRFADPSDICVLNCLRDRVAEGALIEQPFGLWSKCAAVFASYFLENWQQRGEPIAFLLYDPPPRLTPGAPIFIHSDARLAFAARFVRSEHVSGHKLTNDNAERLRERERVWVTYREHTIKPPTRAEYDAFWEAQNGIRALFVMNELTPIGGDVRWKVYGTALQWGYPNGVGYRYLTFPQAHLLTKAIADKGLRERYLNCRD